MSIKPILNTISIHDEIKDYCKTTIPVILEHFKVSNFISSTHLDEYLDIHLLGRNIYISKLLKDIALPNIKKLMSLVDAHKTTVEHLISYKNDAMVMRQLYQNYDNIYLTWDTLSKEHKALYSSDEEYTHGLLLIKENISDNNSKLSLIRDYQDLLSNYTKLQKSSIDIDIADYINKNHKFIHSYVPSYKKNIILINKEIANSVIYPIIINILNAYSVKYTEKNLKEIKDYLNHTYCVVDGFSNLELLLNDKTNESLNHIIYNLYSIEGIHFSEMVALAESYHSLSYTSYNKLSKLLQDLYVDEKSYSYYIKFYASLNNMSNNSSSTDYGAYVKNIFGSLYREFKDIALHTPYLIIGASFLVAFYFYRHNSQGKKKITREIKADKYHNFVNEAINTKKDLEELSLEPTLNQKEKEKLNKRIEELDTAIENLKKKENYQSSQDEKERMLLRKENKDNHWFGHTLNSSKEEKKNILKAQEEFKKVLEEATNDLAKSMQATHKKNTERHVRIDESRQLKDKINTLKQEIEELSLEPTLNQKEKEKLNTIVKELNIATEDLNRKENYQQAKINNDVEARKQIKKDNAKHLGFHSLNKLNNNKEKIEKLEENFSKTKGKIDEKIYKAMEVERQENEKRDFLINEGKQLIGQTNNFLFYNKCSDQKKEKLQQHRSNLMEFITNDPIKNEGSIKKLIASITKIIEPK